VDKTKEMEETPVGGDPQNTEQHFVTMADVAALLEQEKAKTPKERFYSRRPPYIVYSTSRIPINMSHEPSHSIMAEGEASLSM